MENNKRLFENIDLPEAEGLTEVQFKELEKKVKKFLNAEELSKFNALSQEDLELYLLGFYNNVIEWKNAKYSANLPNNDENNDGEGGGQKENDGLDHWRPVKPQKNKKDLQDLEEDTDNKVYPDIKDDLDQSEEQSNKAEEEAENANKNQSNSRNPLDIADNAQSISNSALDIADAAQLAAKAAQEAADQAEKNAQQSRSNSDIENADKSQMKADAAQKLADEATEAANRASDLADEARDAAAQGDAATAAQKTKEAYEATKEAAGKAKAARSNAKDALDASKKTDPNQKQGGLQGGQLSGLQSGQLSGSQSGSQSGLDGDESGSQSGLQGGQLGSASKGGKQKGQLSGQQGGEIGDDLPDPELDEAGDGFDPNGEFEHDEPLDIDLPFDGNDFFADDDEFRESCKEMAERAGQPLDSDDYITPEEYTGKKYQEALPKLSSWKPHSTPGTDGNPPTYLKDVMAKIFATNIDWRSKLEEFMTDKYPTRRNDVWAKRRMGLDPSHPFYIGRYLHPNVEYEEERSGLAQIFFLVDASGSMGVRCGDGENIFTHIMSELIQIELSAKIKYSAYASFNTGPIMRDNIITWTYQDAMDELTLLEKFELPVAGGGTSAIDGIKSIQYYDDVYSTQDPWTLLVVVTDGGDNYNGLSDIVEDPDQIDNMIWIITATSDQWFEAKRKELMKLGIPEDRVICIDIDKEWGVSEKMVKR